MKNSNSSQKFQYYVSIYFLKNIFPTSITNTFFDDKYYSGMMIPSIYTDRT